MPLPTRCSMAAPLRSERSRSPLHFLADGRGGKVMSIMLGPESTEPIADIGSGDPSDLIPFPTSRSTP